MKAIVEVHFPGIKQQLLATALTQFYEISRAAGSEEEALDIGSA